MFLRSGFNAGFVVDATDCMCFWNPAAVKPGEARRIGFEAISSILELDVDAESNSSCRRSVSSVVWKNFVKPCHAVSSLLRDKALLELLVSTHFIVVTSPCPFPWDCHFNFLLQYSLKLADETYMCQTLVHDNCYSLCSPLSALIHRIPKHIKRNAIPSSRLPEIPCFLLKCEVALQLKVKCMMLSDLRMGRL